MPRKMRLKWLSTLAYLTDEDIITAEARIALLVVIAQPSAAADPVTLGLAWERYWMARKINTDMQADGGHWAVYYPELTCADRVEAARELAAGLLEAAEHELLGGN
jgi:hypothetical protein